MIKTGERRYPEFLCKFYFFYESICVECEFGTAARVGVLRIIHFVQVTTIVMVAIHADDEGVDIMLLFQKLLQIVTKETFTSSGNTSDSDERYCVAGHIQASFGDFRCNFALLRLVDWR